jgi:CheY-like chemotaxis protein
VDNQECSRLEQTSHFLEMAMGRVITVNNFSSAYEVFKENSKYFNLIILSTELEHASGFHFISNIKKIQKNIPYLFISNNKDSELFKSQGSTAKNFLLKPVNFKELLEKIYTLCLVNHKEIDDIIKDYDVNYKNAKDQLILSQEDLKEMEFLIDDFEILISEMICLSTKTVCYQVGMKEIHELLQKTYNIFYTFIDEDIKDAIEPFAIALLSFINCVDNIELESNSREDIFETIILLLEDTLKFIEDTVNREKYLHSQYLVDSFIANIDYLKLKSGMISTEENDLSELDFF